LAIQTRLGIQGKIDKQGRQIIRAFLTKQHQQFFAQLSYLIVGTVDESGFPAASIFVGQPGFISILSDRLIQVTAKPLTVDPHLRDKVIEPQRKNQIAGISIELRIPINWQTRTRRIIVIIPH
jgi:predicted pyridoxine 5'-phosphate oxidase superfamily flavin-nucleotide-binding protein